MRPREKVLANKFRLFCSGSLIDYAFAMRLFGDFLTQLTGLNRRIGFWPGATHFVGSWKALADLLSEGVDDPQWFAADGTKFDMTQSYDVLVDCVLPVLRAFAPVGEHDRVEGCLHDVVVSMLRHVGGDLVFLDKNNKSGGAFTIHVNMILQAVILEYTRLRQGRLAVQHYMLCGDDNLLCQSRCGFDPFEYYPDFGIVLKYVHRSDTLTDLEFMSKKFHRRLDGIVPVVDTEKHLCSVKFEKTRSVALFIQKLNSIILESAWSPGVERLCMIRDLIRPLLDRPGAGTKEERQGALNGWWSLKKCRDFHYPIGEKQIKTRKNQAVFRSFKINKQRKLKTQQTIENAAKEKGCKGGDGASEGAVSA
jgi:hypothetical protein